MATKSKIALKRRARFLLTIAVAIVLQAGWNGPNTLPAHDISKTLQPLPSRMLEVGEELEYKVSYSFFTIGTIKTQVLSKETRDGRTVYSTRALIESNPSLSWLVDLHVQFRSEMDGDVYSYYWLADDSTSKEINFRRFRFDYDNGRAYLERGKRNHGGDRKIESTDTVKVSGRCQDGLSLFFYAREHLHSVRQDRIPTLIENKEATTLINFTNRRTDAGIEAVDYPVDVIEFEGKADYVGIFGLTGGFRGWFSNDEQQIPILARMNVILGSIKIQLAKWNRPGWQPPTYVEAPAK